MNYQVKVILDSISPAGVRLTTLEVVMPRFILAEFNTHRVFSRSSASSRAIPVAARIKEVEDFCFVPEAFSKNRPGMQADENVEDTEAARTVWIAAAKDAVRHAGALATLGVHKQHASRLLEPFLWHTVLVTSTEWSNFFALRDHRMAQPEMRRAARFMLEAREESRPKLLRLGEWHRPYMLDFEADEGESDRPADALSDIDDRDRSSRSDEDLNMISAGRCATLSYNRQGNTSQPDRDLERAVMLQTNGHMSPFEHVATPTDGFGNRFESRTGNFRGWNQLRKSLPDESDFSAFAERG